MPVNPLMGVTVMVELPVAPVLKSAGVVAVIVKSTKLKVAMTECVSEVLVPVIVTL
jgi:hypothetical protein